jgi:hypothetical protein
MTSQVLSTYGNIHIDENGYVKSIEYYEEEKAGLDLILQFDLEEYESVYGERDSHYDILDLGYWQYDSTYIEAEPEFRKTVKENMALITQNHCSKDNNDR